MMKDRAMEPSDAALLQACRRGDELAWDLIVERYQRLIYTIALRAGLSEEDAADVLQRVFLILLEQLETIQQPEQLSAWLTSTTRHEAWRMRRRERYMSMISSDDSAGLAEQPDPGPLPAELVERLEQQQLVQRAVVALDPRCQRLLSLLFLQAEAPSYAAIAVQLEMREGAIGPTRARCLEKLRRLMQRSQ
jgi:RNA polymerase sigma factor (sigma-70 family)